MATMCRTCNVLPREDHSQRCIGCNAEVALKRKEQLRSYLKEYYQKVLKPKREAEKLAASAIDAAKLVISKESSNG